MHLQDIVVFLTPLIKPAILAGVAWIGKLLSDWIILFVKNQKLAYAHTLAGVIVRAVEDGFSNVDGNGKLTMAINKLALKVHLPAQDLEDIVRSAYQNTIVPLDSLKNAPAASSTPSTT